MWYISLNGYLGMQNAALYPGPARFTKRVTPRPLKGYLGSTHGFRTYLEVHTGLRNTTIQAITHRHASRFSCVTYVITAAVALAVI